MDEELVGKLDALSEKHSQSRAALIREACRKYVVDEHRRGLERQYVEGYLRIPEDPAMGESGAKLAADVWGAEDFSDWRDK